MIAERKPPTFWPQNPDDDMRMIGALRSLEKENIELKELVVRLSETILRSKGGAEFAERCAEPDVRWSLSKSRSLRSQASHSASSPQCPHRCFQRLVASVARVLYRRPQLALKPS
jgi:hypothetical protein